MSTKKQKHYDNALKARVAMEAIKNERSINEIAAEMKVIPWNVRDWKKQFLENAATVFDRDKGLGKYKEMLRRKDEQIEELYRQIGKLNTNLEWAKKKARQAGIELPTEFD